MMMKLLVRTTIHVSDQTEFWDIPHDSKHVTQDDTRTPHFTGHPPLYRTMSFQSTSPHTFYGMTCRRAAFKAITILLHGSATAIPWGVIYNGMSIKVQGAASSPPSDGQSYWDENNMMVHSWILHLLSQLTVPELHQCIRYLLSPGVYSASS